MNYSYSLNKNTEMVTSTIKLQSTCLFCLLLFLLSVTPIFSQWTDYTIIGRVLDENGQPISKADIRVSPIKYVMEYNVLTNEDGRFSINKRIKKGDTLYFYVSQDSKYSESAPTLIDPPFFDVNVKNKRFFGKPIKFGNKKVVDVGDVNVQFWFNTAYLKLQIDGRNLNKKEWESLWCRLIDEKGEILAQSTIASRGEIKWFDLEKSILKLSLPEGKWEVEFQKFDWEKSKSLPKIIGQTPYFVINKERKTEIINLPLSR